jgi:hypothetical protein
MVPNTKAVIGIHKPVRFVNLAVKYWIEINNIAKHPNWYRKARTCSLVIVLGLSVVGYQLSVVSFKFHNKLGFR